MPKKRRAPPHCVVWLDVWNRIDELKKSGRPHIRRVIAEEFGISQSTISRVIRKFKS